MRPNVRASGRPCAPRRFAPCTPPVVSPAAKSFGIGRPNASNTRACSSIAIPPIVVWIVIPARQAQKGGVLVSAPERIAFRCNGVIVGFHALDQGACGYADFSGKFFERIRPEGVSRLDADDGFLLHEDVVALQAAIVDDRVGESFGKRQNGVAKIVPTSVFAHETPSVVIDHDESGHVRVKPHAVSPSLRTARKT